MKTAYLNDSSLQDEGQKGIQKGGVIQADGGEEIHVDIGQEPEEEEDKDDGRSQEGDVAAVDPYAVISHRSLQEHHDDRPAPPEPPDTHTLFPSFALYLFGLSVGWWMQAECLHACDTRERRAEESQNETSIHRSVRSERGCVLFLLV